MFFPSFPIRFGCVRAAVVAAFVAAIVASLPLNGVDAAETGAKPESGSVAVPENYGQAMRWYERAARAGNARAQFYLGMLYEQGLRGKPGGKPDPKTALIWFEKAAKQGHRQAQLKLGLIYYKGEIVERNYKEAARWFERAAAQGSSRAAYNLALMLVRGQGEKKDAARAAKLFEMAVSRGLNDAALHLAVLYGTEDTEEDRPEGSKDKDQKKPAQPDNLKQDKVTALMWLEWAAGKGLHPDPEFRKKLVGSMTEAEIAVAKKRAAARLKD